MELLTYGFPKTLYRDFFRYTVLGKLRNEVFSIPYRGNFVARFSGIPYRENFVRRLAGISYQGNLVRRLAGISYQGNLVRRFPGMKIAQSDNITATFPCYYVSHIARTSCGGFLQYHKAITQ